MTNYQSLAVAQQAQQVVHQMIQKQVQLQA